MFKSILLPVDLASKGASNKPLELAVELAKKGDATLHVMTVMPDFGMSIVGSYFDKDFEGAAMKDMTAELKNWISRNVPAGLKTKAHMAHGSIYDEIVRLADKLGCDAIVLAAHRPELRDYLLGPNAARVVRHAKQSVLVVRD